MKIFREKIVTGDYQYKALTQGFVAQRFWHHNKIDLFKHLAKIEKGDLILDAGCGSGNLVFEFASSCQKIIGLDINPEAIKFAQSRAREMGLSNTEFIEGNLKDIPLEDNSVDKIILFEVLEHCSREDCQKIIRDLLRILKPKGKIYITTPNYKSLWPFMEWILDTFNLAAILKAKQHVSHFTPNSLYKFLNNQNCDVKKIGTINQISPFLSVLSWKIAKRVFEWEIKHGGFWGPILYCVAIKKQR